jgi:hypothetical protein
MFPETGDRTEASNVTVAGANGLSNEKPPTGDEVKLLVSSRKETSPKPESNADWKPAGVVSAVTAVGFGTTGISIRNTSSPAELVIVSEIVYEYLYPPAMTATVGLTVTLAAVAPVDVRSATTASCQALLFVSDETTSYLLSALRSGGSK